MSAFRKVIFFTALCLASTLLVACGEEPPAADPKAKPTGSGPASQAAKVDKPAKAATATVEDKFPQPAELLEKLKLAHGISVQFSGFPATIAKSKGGNSVQVVEMWKEYLPENYAKSNYVPASKLVLTGLDFRQDMEVSLGSEKDIKVSIHCSGKLSPDGRKLLHLDVSTVKEYFDYLGPKKGLGKKRTEIILKAKLKNLPLSKVAFHGYDPEVAYSTNNDEGAAALKSLSWSKQHFDRKTGESKESKTFVSRVKFSDLPPQKNAFGKVITNHSYIKVTFWYPKWAFGKGKK